MNAVLSLATYADIERLPEHITGEIIAGQLHTQPRPTARHSRIETGIARKVSGPFDEGSGGGPGGWLILVEPELQLSGHVLVPDLAGWRRERLPVTPDGDVDVVPDWVCEILSPSTAVKDRKLKLPLYAQLGVGHAWVADAQSKTIEIYRRDGAHWLLLGTHADQDEMRAEPFDAVSIALASLWDW